MQYNVNLLRQFQFCVSSSIFGASLAALKELGPESVREQNGCSKSKPKSEENAQMILHAAADNLQNNSTMFLYKNSECFF